MARWNGLGIAATLGVLVLSSTSSCSSARPDRGAELLDASVPASAGMAASTSVERAVQRTAETRAILGRGHDRLAARRPNAREVSTVALAPATGVEANGDRLVPRVVADPHLMRARATLPRHADGSSEVVDVASDLHVRFSLSAAQHVEGTFADGHVVYADVQPDVDVVQRPHGGGTEDYLLVRSCTPRRFEYVVDVGEAAGLRYVEGVLELLDAAGTPRLRMAKPNALDANGEEVALRVEVSGCAYDTDSRAPWGRPVVAPSAASCRIALTPALEHAALPVVVDPSWGTSRTMNYGSGGAVLLASGRAFSHNEAAGSELYDPATDVWSVTGGRTSVDRNYAIYFAVGGKVLYPGGCSDGSSGTTAYTSVDVYDESTGTWGSGSALSVPRFGFTAVPLADGRMFLGLGGYQLPYNYRTDADIFDPGTGVWTLTPTAASTGMIMSAGAQIPDGRVIIAGGSAGTFPATNGVSRATLAYSFSTQTWTRLGDTATPRNNHVMVRLSDGRLVLVGGNFWIPTWPTNVQSGPFAEVFDSAAGTWTNLSGTAPSARVSPYVASLNSKQVLLAGGYDNVAATGLKDTWILDQSALTWTHLADMAINRTSWFASYSAAPGGMVAFADGSALAAGGATPNSQRFGVGVGGSCVAASDCNSGFCVDGVCCSTACNTACQACSAAKKASGTADGTCGPAKAAVADPRALCTTFGASTCGTNGQCDGAGACAKYGTTTVCLAAACASGSVKADSKCDGSGTCVAGATTTCGGGLACNGATCKTSCATASLDCVAGISDYCDTSSSCAAKKADGQPCAAAGQCISGSCAGTGGTCGTAPVVDAGGDSGDASETGPGDSGTDTNPGDATTGDAGTGDATTGDATTSDAPAGDAAEVSTDAAVPDAELPDTGATTDAAIQDATDGSTSTCAKGSPGTTCGDGMVVDDTCTCVKGKATPDAGCACSLPDASRTDATAGGLAAMFAGSLMLARRRRGRGAR